MAAVAMTLEEGVLLTVIGSPMTLEGTPAAPTLNVLSATPDGCRGLVLGFDRAPQGSGLYVITSSDGGAIPSIQSVAVEPDPLHTYSHLLRLAFATPGTGAKSYLIQIVGLTGPCDEALGDFSASWTAPAPTAVHLTGAEAESETALVYFTDQDLRDTTALRDPASYTVTSTDPNAALVTVRGATLRPGFVQVFVTPTTGGCSYTLTVTASKLTSLDGGTNAQATAGFLAYLGTSAPWIPPGVTVTLDGAPMDGSSLSLLPSPGEPDGAFLVRAAWLSLLGKRLAATSDKLPDPWGDPPDRGGWWGDFYSSTPGDLWGSRLWLLYRARGDDVPARAEEYVREALSWLVEDGIAAAVDCTAIPQGRALLMDVTINRPASKGTRLRWDLWAGL